MHDYKQIWGKLIIVGKYINIPQYLFSLANIVSTKESLHNVRCLLIKNERKNSLITKLGFCSSRNWILFIMRNKFVN